ncbi:D(4) dopamine receptor-like [Arapaima gigas]
MTKTTIPPPAARDTLRQRRRNGWRSVGLSPSLELLLSSQPRGCEQGIPRRRCCSCRSSSPSRATSAELDTYPTSTWRALDFASARNISFLSVFFSTRERRRSRCGCELVQETLCHGTGLYPRVVVLKVRGGGGHPTPIQDQLVEKGAGLCDGRLQKPPGGSSGQDTQMKPDHEHPGAEAEKEEEEEEEEEKVGGPADMPANRSVSNHSVPAPGVHEHNVAALVFGALLIVVIICGNVLVCLSVHTEKALKTTTNYFIVSLAAADLLLAVLVLPLYVYAEFQGGVWALNMVICDGLMTMDVMLCTASIFNLCAISVDRFIAVSIPLNYNRKHIDQRQIILLSATWILALAVASPVMFGINNVPHRDTSRCQLEDDNYVVYSSICSFFIPCPIMLLLYCGMFRGLRRWEEARKAKLRNSILACRKLQQAAAAALPPLAALPPPLPPVIECDLTDARPEELECYSQPDSPLPSEYKNPDVPTVAYPEAVYVQTPPRRKRAKINCRERKAMKVLPVVVGAFLFCWTPFFVVHTMRAICKTCDISPRLMSTVTWLGYVNSAINPVIYTVFNTEFRNFFRKFLHSCC